jgi:hypothetical protein
MVVLEHLVTIMLLIRLSSYFGCKDNPFFFNHTSFSLIILLQPFDTFVNSYA